SKAVPFYDDSAKTLTVFSSDPFAPGFESDDLFLGELQTASSGGVFAPGLLPPKLDLRCEPEPQRCSEAGTIAWRADYLNRTERFLHGACSVHQRDEKCRESASTIAGPLHRRESRGD